MPPPPARTWSGPGLCAEAQRLGRILAGLMPGDPEVWGLLALMELQASRLPARTGRDGAAVPLTEQNRARWDGVLVRRGLAALARAEALGGAEGPYALQAALAACHARARRAEETDWRRLAGLYDRLREVAPSPVVELNRAVAHSMAFGPEAGLALVRRAGGAPCRLCAASGGEGGLPAPGRAGGGGAGRVPPGGGAYAGTRGSGPSCSGVRRLAGAFRTSTSRLPWSALLRSDLHHMMHDLMRGRTSCEPRSLWTISCSTVPPT